MDAVAPRILAQGLLVLRENAVMPRLVNRDYESDAKMKGQVVDVPLPGSSQVNGCFAFEYRTNNPRIRRGTRFHTNPS